jgi:hypothetical protein
MQMTRRLFTGLLAAVLLAAGCGGARQTALWIEPVETIAPGVELFRSTDSTLLEPAAPIAIHLLKLDPARVRLESALAHGQIMGAERVEGIALREGALAAVNGGFFNVRNGEPTGVLKVDGELVSDNGPLKGGVIIRAGSDGGASLSFDLIAVRMSLSFTVEGRDITIPIDGVDTTRARGRLMLYTPAYHAHTDTAPNGTEWVLDGDPLRVVDVQSNVGQAAIPRRGAALSYGGLDLPESLAALKDGQVVRLSTEWRTASGVTIEHIQDAGHVVNGAGLLRRGGETIWNWDEEGLKSETFTAVRHPRTVIGVDRSGAIWLVAIDGRQPDYSNGMNFAELQRLADRLDLTDALNLDGGGSTTMVVRGKVVNRPSDPTGPRAVSDAIVVFAR